MGHTSFENKCYFKTKSYIRRWSTFPIKSMFEGHTKGIQVLGISDPSSLTHPQRIFRPFTSNHYEDRASWFVECVVDKVSL